MWKPRTTPVEYGESPYAWDVPSQYECTWFCYYRSIQAMGCSPATWWDRATKTGSYTNAKDWLANYRDPWEVKGTDWKPVAGDILVYDGEYGHVIFCETDVMTSEYRNGDPGSFRNAKIGDYKGVLLGVLHYPYEPLNTVDRNENVDQIQTTDESLRTRTKPSLDAEIIGHVQLGYYNVLDTKEADGYKWFKLAKDRWCANETVNYLPANDDIIRELEKYFDAMKQSINTLTDERDEYKGIIKEVHKLTDVGD